MGKRNRAQYTNRSTFLMWWYKLRNIALTIYEWKNLPDTVDERYIELELFNNGYAIYFNDFLIGDLCLGGTIGGNFNPYGIPNSRQAKGLNGYTKDLTAEDSVIIWNNYSHNPTGLLCDMYAERIANLDRVIDVNVNAQRTPIIIYTTQNKLLSTKNFYQQYSGNEPLIIADREFSPDDFVVINNQSPYVADKINNLKKEFINEFLSTIGVENSPIIKKERVQSSEVNAEFGQIKAQRDVGLAPRREAAKQINQMFGTNIEVNFRSDTLQRIETLTNIEKGEEENGQVYDFTS